MTRTMAGMATWAAHRARSTTRGARVTKYSRSSWSMLAACGAAGAGMGGGAHVWQVVGRCVMGEAGGGEGWGGGGEEHEW
jgi:hypothetical protein